MREPRVSSTLVPAAHVYLRRNGRVLLQQRCGTGYLDGHWVASAAGHVEQGETALACAVRELDEEIGVRALPEDLKILTVMQRTDGTDNPREQRIDWFFELSRWHGEPRICEPSKCSGLVWFELADLPTPIPDYERTLLASDGTTPLVSSYGFDGNSDAHGR